MVDQKSRTGIGLGSTIAAVLEGVNAKMKSA